MSSGSWEIIALWSPCSSCLILIDWSVTRQHIIFNVEISVLNFSTRVMQEKDTSQCIFMLYCGGILTWRCNRWYELVFLPSRISVWSVWLGMHYKVESVPWTFIFQKMYINKMVNSYIFNRLTNVLWRE